MATAAHPQARGNCPRDGMGAVGLSHHGNERTQFDGALYNSGTSRGSPRQYGDARRHAGKRSRCGVPSCPSASTAPNKKGFRWKGAVGCRGHVWPRVVRPDAPRGQPPLLRAGCSRALAPTGQRYVPRQDWALDADNGVAWHAPLLREVPGQRVR